MFEALVFSAGNGDVDTEAIPRYVSYKIRMDVDRVDSTRKFKVTDRFVKCVTRYCLLFNLLPLHCYLCMYVFWGKNDEFLDILLAFVYYDIFSLI